MPATHCRLVLSVFPLHIWVSLNYWDKLNFMISTTKEARPNIDGLVKPLNLHHTAIPAQAGIH